MDAHLSVSSVGENILCTPGSQWMNIFRRQVSVKTFVYSRFGVDEHLSASSADENILYTPGSEWMNIFRRQVPMKTFFVLNEVNIFLCQVSVKTFGVYSRFGMDEHLLASSADENILYTPGSAV